MGFKTLPIEQINENFIKNIGTEWMLITAGNKDKHNMMTASWGFAGVMWGFPCAIAAIRPQRYTLEFVEKEKYYSLSFYGEDKKLHGICGKKSGRDMDKTAATGLTPIFDNETGTPYFNEARLVLICEKVYQQDLNKDGFLSDDIPNTVYAANDYHKMIYGKIVKALIKE